jgi:hypothetical protein
MSKPGAVLGGIALAILAGIAALNWPHRQPVAPSPQPQTPLAVAEPTPSLEPAPTPTPRPRPVPAIEPWLMPPMRPVGRCDGDDAAALACVLRSRVDDDPLFGFDAATMDRAERAALRERLGR